MALLFFSQLWAQFKAKKSWWIEAVFYLVLAITAALIILYLILILKISFQEKRSQELGTQIAKFATLEQINLEREIIEYQKKINTFAILLSAHRISSNVFDFFEQNIFPNVRFSSFSLSNGEPGVDLSGESEDVLSLARQLVVFKENELVEDIKSLSLSMAEGGKITFSTSLSFNPAILIWK